MQDNNTQLITEFTYMEKGKNKNSVYKHSTITPKKEMNSFSY